MKQPKGKLVAVGGAVNHEEQKEHRLAHYDEGIMAHIAGLLEAKKDPVVGIISSASHIPGEAAADYIHCFKKLGCRHVHHLDIPQRELAYERSSLDRIRKADCIVFTGGDQQRLCSILGGSPVIDLLKEKYLDENFVLAGVSAGAAAMSQTMISAGKEGRGYQKGSVELAIGLGFLPGVIVDTHFDKRGRFGRLAQAVITQPGTTGIGLGEDTGVILSKGRELKAIGSSSVVLIDGSQIRWSNIAAIEDGMAISSEELKVHLMATGDVFDLAGKKFKTHGEVA